MKVKGKEYIETTLDCFGYDSPQIIETTNNDTATLDLLFTNVGTSVCYINSFPLTTNQSLRFSCNEGELLSVKVNLTFASGGTNKCYMMRRRIK